MFSRSKLFFITIILFLWSGSAAFSLEGNITGSPETTKPEDEKASFSLSDVFSYNAPVKKGPDDKIFYYNLSGWYSRLTGNTNTLDSNFSTAFEIDNNISNFIFSLNAFYGKADDETNKNKGAGTIKYDHYVVSRIELFVFSKSEYNRMSLLDHRNNSGAGGKFVFFKSDYLKFDISGAFVYQYENYEGIEPERDYRWSLRGRIVLYPMEGLKLSYVYFYIPKIDSRLHYRTELETYISYKLNSAVSIKAGYTNDYNKDAPPGTKKTDENIYAQVSLDF